jgi:hypothetical protein
MQYEGLEFNPFLLDEDELIWEKYPDLADNPSFCQLSEDDHEKGMTLQDLSLLVSFVILYIDADSPHYKEIDINRRVSGCMKPLKIKPGSLVFNEIESHSSRFSDIMYEYFVWENNIPFEGWLSLKTQIHHQYKYLRTPMTDIDDMDLEADRKSKVQERLIKLERILMEKESKLFPSKRIQKQISRENIKKELTAYAEKYAQHHPVLKAR